MRYSYLLILLCFIYSNAFLSAQNTVPLEYDHTNLFSVTGNAELGSLYPIDKNIGIAIIGMAKIMLVNLASGKTIKHFDETKLNASFTSYLKKNYKDYELFTDDELSLLPSCQRHSYIFRRIYYLPKENIYACDISLTVNKGLEYTNNYSVDVVIFFDKDLNINSLHTRETYSEAPLLSLIGGFFIGKEHYFIKKAVSTANEPNEFIHFQLINGIYKFVEKSSLIGAPSTIAHFPGRHISNISFDDYSYLYNGTKLIKTDNIIDPSFVREIQFPVNKNEFMAVLRKVNNDKIIGLKIDVDERGITYFSTLFLYNSNFSSEKNLIKYDALKTRFLSMEVHEDQLTLLLFDRIKNKYLIQTINLL